MEGRRTGKYDRIFLEKCFHKLLLNFTWWVNKVDGEGNNVFEGGFLGLDNITVIDRSSMNAWEDAAFRAAVDKTGRRRLVFGALYTEICLAFPVVHALADGREVGFVSDAVGGLSQLAHRSHCRPGPHLADRSRDEGGANGRRRAVVRVAICGTTLVMGGACGGGVPLRHALGTPGRG